MSDYRRKLLQAGVLITALLLLAAREVSELLFESARPGFYYQYHAGPLGHNFSFPYVGVSVSIGLLVTEAGLIAFVLTREFGPLWLRGMCCLGALVPLALFGLVTAMHSPPYYGVHVEWLIFSAIFVMITVLASGAARLYRRFRRGQP
jgi:hypothetical protein